MSEMEELKKNTEIQKVLDTRKELKYYLFQLEKEIQEANYWVRRAQVLQTFAILSHFVIVVAAAIQDMIWAADLGLLIFFITVMRSMFLSSRSVGAMKELLGVIRTLEILGMVESGDEDLRDRVKKKRNSMFPRFKELWERVGSGKTKPQPA